VVSSIPDLRENSKTGGKKICQGREAREGRRRNTKREPPLKRGEEKRKHEKGKKAQERIYWGKITKGNLALKKDTRKNSEGRGP